MYIFVHSREGSLYEKRGKKRNKIPKNRIILCRTNINVILNPIHNDGLVRILVGNNVWVFCVCIFNVLDWGEKRLRNGLIVVFWLVKVSFRPHCYPTPLVYMFKMADMCILNVKVITIGL